MANFAAVGLLALGLIFRFVYMFTSETKSANYSGFWFFFETVFYGLFLALVGFALHPNQENPHSVAVRTHFRILDFDFGRGLFMFYLAM